MARYAPVTLTVAFLLAISLPGSSGQDDETVTAIVAVSCVLGFLLAILLAVIIFICFRRKSRRRMRSKRNKLQDQFAMQNGAVRTPPPSQPPPLPPPREPSINTKPSPVIFRPVNPSPTRSANRSPAKQPGVLVYRPKPAHHYAVERYSKHKIRHQTRPHVFTLPPLRLATYRPKMIRTSFSPSDVRESFPDGFRHYKSSSVDGPYTSPTHKWTAVYQNSDHLRKENQRIFTTREEHGHIIDFADSDSDPDLATKNEVRKYVDVNYLAGRKTNNNEQIVIVDYVVYDDDDKKDTEPTRQIRPMISKVSRSDMDEFTHPLREALSDSVLENEDIYHRRQRAPRMGSLTNLPDEDHHSTVESQYL